MARPLCVALIGSSGGGAATLTSGTAVVENLKHHIEAIRRASRNHEFDDAAAIISEVLLLQCDVGMDFAKTSPVQVNASLWMMEDGTALTCRQKGKLSEVNEKLREMDKRLAELILNGHIDALMTVSCDPDDTNSSTIDAAIQVGIPIVGTGGSSISAISTKGGNVIGCSGGSVATTGVSRGICFAASLAAHWGSQYHYRPPHPPKTASFHSVIGAALPILLAVSVFRSLLAVIGLIADFAVDLIDVPATSIRPSFLSGSSKMAHSLVKGWSDSLVSALEVRVLPVVIGAITCIEVS
jgi:hypothetical protein